MMDKHEAQLAGAIEENKKYLQLRWAVTVNSALLNSKFLS